MEKSPLCHLNYCNIYFIKLPNNSYFIKIGPTKRRSQSGNTSILGGGIDSPCSSRASVAGSSCSEPWSTSSNGGTGEDAVNVSNYQGKSKI